MFVGAHLSIQKGLIEAGRRIVKIGGNALQIFTSPPRGWRAPSFSAQELEEFKRKKGELGVRKFFIHAKYLVNIGSQDKRIRDLSLDSLFEDLEFAERAGAEGVIFHPRLKGREAQVIASIKEILEKFKGGAFLILEPSAQENFKDYSIVFEKVRDERLRLCLDTAHVFQSGWDMGDPTKFFQLFELLAKRFKDKLVVVHSNDSKTELGSKHDVHQNIGEGHIPKEAFFAFLNHPLTENLPFILETPGFKEKDGKSDRKNIKALKKLKGKRLGREFFLRDAVWVAKNLLGKYLVVKKQGEFFAGRIVETEAYVGPEDKASHAFGGRRTKRTEVMFEIGGKVYVYLIYGMYHCLNIVTGEKGFPSAVLIRAVEPVVSKRKKLDGPGKLCSAFSIDREDNGKDVVTSEEIFIVDIGEKPKKITSTPRIGVDYAGEWANKPLRFLIKGE